MKKIVVFFTNEEKIKKVLSGRPKPQIEMSNNKPIKIEVKDCKDNVVYILSDDSTECYIDEIVKNCDKGYYIYHNETNIKAKEKLIIKGFISVEDHHEPQGNTLAQGYYLWLNEVGLENMENGNKKFVSIILKDLFDKLWNKLDNKNELGNALDLLHQLNNGETPDLPEEIKAFNGADIDFQNEINKIKDVVGNADAYIQALTTFRDVLLYGV